MTGLRFLEGRRVGVSVSDSVNLAQLGLGPEHVENDLVEVTRYLVAAGATVVYGGDLRRGGFTGLLLEMVARHQARDNSFARFENFLAWPVHAGIPFAELAEVAESFVPVGELVLLDEGGRRMELDERRRFDKLEVKEASWGPPLTAMRETLAAHCDARIVAGGATTIYKGAMPGVAEEALLSIKAGKPTFVVGALGGCALDIGLLTGLASSPLGLSADWTGQERFRDLAGALNPGLDRGEAAALASPILGTEMLVLLLRGLSGALSEPTEEAQLARIIALPRSMSS